jgi:peptidoglycan/xylan/chitin deacetylase (PgdA/CDA1 family)
MNRLLILIYHRVLDGPDPLRPGQVTREIFRTHLAVLRKWFRVLPLATAVQELRLGTLAARAVSITFDDGYADNYLNAAPILADARMTATFFVATGFLDGGCMWNDALVEAVRRTGRSSLDLEWLGLGARSVARRSERAALIVELIRRLKYLPAPERLAHVDGVLAAADVDRPADLMMTPQQLRELAGAGMEIGAHTVQHPILAQLSLPAAREEIDGSRDSLERLIGRPVVGFAYPNGRPGTDYKAEHVAAVRDCGFAFAVSTARGAARGGDDQYQLPRVGVWTQTAWKTLLNLGLAFGSKQAQRV